MLRLRRLALCLAIALTVFSSAFLGWVYWSQDSMIYHPEKYMKAEYKLVPHGTARLDFVTNQGKQSAWYTPPKQGDPAALPPTLWVLFNGNASLALHWTDAIKRSPDHTAGFLVFDYPGYGDSEGKPTPARLQQTADGAMAALAKHLNTDIKSLAAKKIRVLGYSMGSAVALEFATRYHTDRIVLAAPFTTMRAMADRIAGRHLSWLLAHRFNNLDSLENIAKQDPAPRVIITHGVPDLAVPIQMSREMHKHWPNLIELVEREHASHTSILDDIQNYFLDDLPKPIESFEKLTSRANDQSTTSTFQ